tara:strand:+ start:287 stop:418 length:132 start_codon:yes stop_codon:yes gene_type:complete
MDINKRIDKLRRMIYEADWNTELLKVTAMQVELADLRILNNKH